MTYRLSKTGDPSSFLTASGSEHDPYRGAVFWNQRPGENDFHILENGSVTVVGHLHKILDVTPDLIFMDDTARVTNECLVKETIVSMELASSIPGFKFE